MALQDLPKSDLSRREREVAALVAEGLTNREIARRLFISERTADGHLEHIREKLGVTNRAQVAAWFVAQSRDDAAVVAAPRVHHRRANNVRVASAFAIAIALILVGVVVVTQQLAPTAPTGPIITTVAGSTREFGTIWGGHSGDYGPATSAQLSRPEDVAVNPKSGLIYIADSQNQMVRRIDAEGIITVLAGGGATPFVEGGYAPTTAIGPVNSVAVAPDGAVYFSSSAPGFSLIARVDADLSLHSVPLGLIVAPAGIRFAPDGTLYIADLFGDTVWRRTPDGRLSIYAGTGDHSFDGDNGAATGAKLRYPTNLSLDRGGNLYIADTGNNRIRRVDAASHVITTVAGSSDTYGYSGDGGLADRALLSLPFGVAVAANGDVYIADTGNNRVRRVDAKTRLITTIAGTGNAGFAGDGSIALNAELYGPNSLAFDSFGNLYVVDLGNHRIRMIHGVSNP